VVVPELRRERGAEGAHLGGGALHGDAGLEPAVGDEEVAAAGGRVQLALQWHEDVRAAVGEVRRHHADDFVGLAVERDPAADDRGVTGKVTGPEAVGEHRDAASAGLVLVVAEPASVDRVDAEHVDERRRRLRGGDPHRLAGTGHHEGRLGRPADRGEHLVACLPVDELRVGRRARGARRLRVVDRDDPVGVRVRQGFEEDAVEDVEDGGGHADAKGEGDDRQQADERSSQAGADRVPDVLDYT
jgi:hypothetical protein